jgi:cytochrome c556
MRDVAIFTAAAVAAIVLTAGPAATQQGAGSPAAAPGTSVATVPPPAEMPWEVTRKIAEAAARSIAQSAGEDGPVPSDAEMAGARDPHDAIIARRVLTTTVEHNADEIAAMIADPSSLNPAEAVEHAETISTLLLAFPRLFPADSNIHSAELEAERPDLVSLARPAAWQDYASFCATAKGAADLAFQASRARSLDEFVTRAEAMLAACDGCHAAYRRY